MKFEKVFAREKLAVTRGLNDCDLKSSFDSRAVLIMHLDSEIILGCV